MARNIPELYADAMQVVRTGGGQAPSRNGQVLTLPNPHIFFVENPTQRVLFHPMRRANPYFHVMEAVWMMAGQNYVAPLMIYNGNMANFAEGDGVINGAYGHRWRHQFGRDQIVDAINALKEDPYSRQVVLQMWDNNLDGVHRKVKDRPCNTHIYLRRVGGCLDMTVCNRSNDVVWGLAGANAVHMTLLQEFIASCLNWPVGMYYVMTNNVHVYEHHWPLFDDLQPYDLYHETSTDLTPQPILGPRDDYVEFLYECKQLMKSPDYIPKSSWLRGVAAPMQVNYRRRCQGYKDDAGLEEITSPDWKLACRLWGEWCDS
jgi:hypothetical protein